MYFLSIFKGGICLTKPKRGWLCACASWLGVDVIPWRFAKEILIPVLGAFLAQIAVVMASASVLSGQDVPILVASMGPRWRAALRRTP